MYRTATQVCENARLVPQDREAWFVANDMGRYNRSGAGTSVNDVANGVTLRCDVRRLLEFHAFVFYPIGGGKAVTYVVRRDMQDFADVLHGRTVTVPVRVSDEFLYARFAYNIINLLQPRVPDVSIERVPITEALRQQKEALWSMGRTSSKTGRSNLSSAPESQDSCMCFDLVAYTLLMPPTASHI